MQHWPLRDLVLRTPRLELRPDDDEGLLELVEVAYGGVHPPEEMPFLTPWTDADPAYLGRGILQYHWLQRSSLAPDDWKIHFLVRLDGRVAGMQSLVATTFAVAREVRTGSWLGLPHHGRGVGTEMRAAVLTFAFDHLGATRARSSAFVDNAASHRVSEKLGYRPDGSETQVRRGKPVDDVRLLVTPSTFVRPGWTLDVETDDGIRALLGA